MLKTFLISLLIFILNLPILIVIQAIDEQPLTTIELEQNDVQIANIQQLLIDHDPRRLLIGTDEQIIQLSQNEVNALLTYFKSAIITQLNLNNPFLEITQTDIQAELSADKLTINISTPVTSGPFGEYINYSIIAVEHENSLRIENIKIGDLLLPGHFYQTLINWTQPLLENANRYQLLTTLQQSIDYISLHEGAIALEFNWQADSLSNIQEQARRTFINETEANRLMHYHSVLVTTINDTPSEQRVLGLNALLQPMFAAANVLTSKGADPVMENRAVFIILATYLTDLRLEHLLGTSASESTFVSPRQINIVVDGRRDLARHIIGSAAISSSAGASIANILSIYKEVQDSRYRSGFSFSDITANEVGSALGSLATQNPELATQMQELLIASVNESDYMPQVGRIDGLTEEEFITLYESRNSPAYRLRLAEIKQQIAQRPIFQTIAAATESP